MCCHLDRFLCSEKVPEHEVVLLPSLRESILARGRLSHIRPELLISQKIKIFAGLWQICCRLDRYLRPDKCVSELLLAPTDLVCCRLLAHSLPSRPLPSLGESTLARGCLSHVGPELLAPTDLVFRRLLVDSLPPRPLPSLEKSTRDEAVCPT